MPPLPCRHATLLFFFQGQSSAHAWERENNHDNSNVRKTHHKFRETYKQREWTKSREITSKRIAFVWRTVSFSRKFSWFFVYEGGTLMPASSETQGQSIGSGERARRKFSSTFESRAPGNRLSPNYFQNFKQMPAPDWAQKMLCIIAPNRRTISPEFFSWARTRQLLSCHTCPVRSPSLCEQGKLLFSTFLTRNEGTTDESKKRLGCYQQEQFNLPREYSVFDSSQCIVNNKKIKMRRRRESQISKTTTLHVHHTFLYISLPSTARLPVEMSNFFFFNFLFLQT